MENKYLNNFRALTIFLVLLVLNGCGGYFGHKQIQENKFLPPNPIVNCDSLHKAYDTLLLQHTNTLFIHIDSIQQLNITIAHERLKHARSEVIIDSLNKALFLSNYRISQAKYYLKICKRNPSQDKFLKGWMNRALNE